MTISMALSIIGSFAAGVVSATAFFLTRGRINIPSGILSRDKMKMALVVRSDISIGKGKACSQCAHAAVSCYKKALSTVPMVVRRWEMEGQTKVVLKVNGTEGLEELATQARAEGLVSVIIHDAGRTQIERGTATVVGIGPGPMEHVDKVTGHLKLY